MIKTVLELDLIGYSDIARELEEHFDAELVLKFNDQIKGFVDEGLSAIGKDQESLIVKDSGDGAIVILDKPEQAHHFAKVVNKACRDHNWSKTLESAKRWFRIAAATKDIAIRGKDFAGMAVCVAVRLETAGEAGHFLVDVPTWEGLPENLKEQYLHEELVHGKRNEMIRSHRVIFDDELHRPDHVIFTLKHSLGKFNHTSQKAIVRDLSRLLNSREIFLVRICPQGINLTVCFKDCKALAKFIAGNTHQESDITDFLSNWDVDNISHHVTLKGLSGPKESFDKGETLTTNDKPHKSFSSDLEKYTEKELRTAAEDLNLEIERPFNKTNALLAILAYAKRDEDQRLVLGMLQSFRPRP